MCLTPAPIPRCQLTVQGTGQVALACPPVPLFLVAGLVWLLKVSRPPGYGESFLGFLFSHLNKMCQPEKHRLP